MKNHPFYLIVHHTGGTDANPLFDTSKRTFAEINEYHRQRWDGTTQSSLGFYCGYHYYIENDGIVIQARADEDEGAHTIGLNSQSLGICLAGNFDFSLPTPAQVEALRKLLIEKMEQYTISPYNIVPQRTFAIKTCYGMRLADDWARKLVSGHVEKKISIIKQLILLLVQAVDRMNVKAVGAAGDKGCEGCL